MLKVFKNKSMLLIFVMLLIVVTFVLPACTSATAKIVTNTQTITSTMIQATTIQQLVDENIKEPILVSDEQILAQVNKIVRGLGLDVNPGLDFSAKVENGIVILDGTVLYPDEESLIQSVESIRGVVKIISNFELLAE